MDLGRFGDTKNSHIHLQRAVKPDIQRDVRVRRVRRL